MTTLSPRKHLITVPQTTIRRGILPHANIEAYLFDWTSPVDGRSYRFAVHQHEKVALGWKITHVHSGMTITGKIPFRIAPDQAKSVKKRVAAASAYVDRFSSIILGHFQAKLDAAEKLPPMPVPVLMRRNKN